MCQPFLCRQHIGTTMFGVRNLIAVYPADIDRDSWSWMYVELVTFDNPHFCDCVNKSPKLIS
jgi:chorismate mutase